MASSAYTKALVGLVKSRQAWSGTGHVLLCPHSGVSLAEGFHVRQAHAHLPFPKLLQAK